MTRIFEVEFKTKYARCDAENPKYQVVARDAAHAIRVATKLIPKKDDCFEAHKLIGSDVIGVWLMAETSE